VTYLADSKREFTLSHGRMEWKGVLRREKRAKRRELTMLILGKINVWSPDTLRKDRIKV